MHLKILVLLVVVCVMIVNIKGSLEFPRDDVMGYYGLEDDGSREQEVETGSDYDDDDDYDDDYDDQNRRYKDNHSSDDNGRDSKPGMTKSKIQKSAKEGTSEENEDKADKDEDESGTGQVGKKVDEKKNDSKTKEDEEVENKEENGDGYNESRNTGNIKGHVGSSEDNHDSSGSSGSSEDNSGSSGTSEDNSGSSGTSEDNHDSSGSSGSSEDNSGSSGPSEDNSESSGSSEDNSGSSGTSEDNSGSSGTSEDNSGSSGTSEDSKESSEASEDNHDSNESSGTKDNSGSSGTSEHNQGYQDGDIGSIHGQQVAEGSEEDREGKVRTHEDVRNQVEQLSGGDLGDLSSGTNNGTLDQSIAKFRTKQNNMKQEQDSRDVNAQSDNGKDNKDDEDTSGDKAGSGVKLSDSKDDKDTSGDKTGSGGKLSDSKDDKDTSGDKAGSGGKASDSKDDEDTSGDKAGSGSKVKEESDNSKSNDENNDLSSEQEVSTDEDEDIIVNTEKTEENNKPSKVKKENVENLLKELVPSGVLPHVPEGLEKLAEMSTVSFTYDVDENDDVTVTSDISEPLKLFDQKLSLTNIKLTFNYKDRQKKGMNWKFEAQAIWIKGNQRIQVMIENSKKNDHFTLTGEGESLALDDFASLFVSDADLASSDINVATFKKTVLSEAEMYIVFKDDKNIVSLASGKVTPSNGKSWVYKTYIQKFPKKEPTFSIMIDFPDTTTLSSLPSVINAKLASVPFVDKLLNNKGPLMIGDGGFSLVASSADVDQLQLSVFADESAEQELGSRISSGVTLTLPMMVQEDNDIDDYKMAVKISQSKVRFIPDEEDQLEVTKILKTLSEYTRPKIISLGYPDLSQVMLKELAYDNRKSTYTVRGSAQRKFTLLPGLLELHDATLDFEQLVPGQFVTLALFGHGRAPMGGRDVDVHVWTDSVNGQVLIEGKAHKLQTSDIGDAFGATMETDDDSRKILKDNQMLNMELDNARMFTLVNKEVSGAIHFHGSARPPSWTDPIQLEIVVFRDLRTNKQRMSVGYMFDKLPLTYAIDALTFNKFPSPRMLDNSRNTTLVLSPVDTNSMFVSQAMSGLSFKKGLTLIGQFRLPDVCSLNRQCEAAAHFLGTEKWYRVQGLISLRGFSLNGYIDADFPLAKNVTLKNNIIEFMLGNYSYMGVTTALHMDKNNLTFRGYMSFDDSGIRLRMSTNTIWSHPFPGGFLNFDQLQMDVPLVSGIPLNEFLVTGELNFGLQGSLYRLFAPAYLTFKASDFGKVGFQATLTNISMDTITNALNFKSSLPAVLRQSRFPETLVLRYKPEENAKELELFGKLQMMQRTMVCRLEMNDVMRIQATTSHSRYPLILDNGLVMVYADKDTTKLGPRALFTITPKRTKFRLEGYATFNGMGTNTDIEVTESGTQFSLYGDLFGLTKTVVSFMSPDGLTEHAPYMTSACIPKVIPRVIARINHLVTMAAYQAQSYMKEASRNYHQANVFHNEALHKEKEYKEVLSEEESSVELDNRDMFVAEERLNRTCRRTHCDKTCIGCTGWRKCCDRDVFGNCVNCPAWKACCWRGANPVCKAKNHGCAIMREMARENLHNMAGRVYRDKKAKVSDNKKLWQTEYLKGKTQAVVDAADRAIHLVSHDSQVGLKAAQSIKKYGPNLVNIKNVCFQTTLKNLATSCVHMNINASFPDKPGTNSLPYYGCLNHEVVPKMAQHIINYMFPPRVVKPQNHTKKKASNGKRHKKFAIFRHLARWRRSAEDEAGDSDDDDRPFWVFRQHHRSTLGMSLLQQRTNVPRSPLRKKWQIPATRKGKCKVYRQLMEICKDMMSTVQLMYRSYADGKEQFLKRKVELEMGLNTTIADLEKQVLESPDLQDRLGDIELNIRTVGAGVKQWRLNCEKDQKEQNKLAIQEWVDTMEGRITMLGGQGVERFLSNLFRAFEGMFLGADSPRGNAEEVLSTLQSIREISATFHDIFGNKQTTLEKANSRAEIVQAQLKHVKQTKIFCN